MHLFRSARWTPRVVLPAVMLLSLGGTGCGSGDGKDSKAPTNVRITGGITAGETVNGTRTLQATAEDDSGKIARVEFDISGAIACVDGTAKSSGSVFSCAWDPESTTPGEHPLVARAYDAAGNATASEPLSFTVPPPNHAPTISQVTAGPTSLEEGSPTTLTVTASDVDGDALTYSWSQVPFAPAGTWSEDTGSVRTWTAPLLSSNTSFTLKVTVTDGKGGSAQATVDVAVANVPSRNRAPTVDESIAVPTDMLLAGDTVNLSIGARDADGDALTYTWTTSPAGQGTFDESTDSVAQWRSPEISATRSFTVQVTVSDGTTSVTRSGEVQVQLPTYARDIQPLWTPACTDCHNDSSPSGNLSLQAGSAYANLVNVIGYGACNSLKRVQPGNPDESLLVQRISNDSCGSRMPRFDPEYFDRSPGEVTRIRSWILAGAPNN